MFLTSIKCFAYADSMTKAASLNAFQGQKVNLSATYSYGIQNNTFYPQEYKITYTLCPLNKECYQNTITIVLGSTERISKQFSVSLPVTYNNTGTYTLRSTIDIHGESSSSSQNTGFTTVYSR